MEFGVHRFFLPTIEAETSDNIKEKLVAASSSHTVRSKVELENTLDN